MNFIFERIKVHLQIQTLLACLFLIQCFGIAAQNPINATYKGEPDGPNVDYHKNGAVMITCEIKNGNIHGDRYSYFKDGKLEIKEQFDNGEYNGTNYCLNERGDTLYIEVYAHDSLLFNKNISYYKSGRVEYVTTTQFILDSTMRKGVFPAKNRRNTILVDENKIEDVVHNNCTEILYYESGKIKSFIQYKNGLHNGLYILYYENGQKKQDSPCLNGKYDGPYYEYFPSGAIKIKTSNKNDYYDGEYVEYDKNGHIIKQLVYKEGIKQ